MSSEAAPKPPSSPELPVAPCESSGPAPRRPSGLDPFLAAPMLLAALYIFAWQAYPLKGLYAIEVYHDLVYARSMNLGLGLTYMGLPSEGWSNLLWVTMLQLLGMVTDDLLSVAQYLGLLMSVLTLCLMMLWSRDLFDRYWPGALTALMLACSPTFVLWSGAGLDVPLFTMLLTLAMWLTMRDVKCRQPLRSAPAWVVVMLARPEGAGMAAVAWLVILGLAVGGQLRGRMVAATFWLLLVGGMLGLVTSLRTGGPEAAVALAWTSFEGIGALVGSGTLAEEFSEFVHLHHTLMLLSLLLAAVTLARCPQRLAPAFVGLHVLVVAWLVMGLMAGGAIHAQGGLAFVPILPALVFSGGAGVTMLVYHHTRHWLVGSVYALLLGAFTVGVFLLTVQAPSTRLKVAHEFLDAAPDSYRAAANFLAVLDGQHQRAASDDEAVPAVASFDGPAISYHARQPVLDLLGRHQPAIQLASLHEMVEVIHLPVDLGDTPEAPIFLRHREAARLYYSEDFQRHYRQVGNRMVPMWQRRSRPLANHLMKDFFRGVMQVSMSNHVRQRMPTQARVTLRNEGSGTWLGVPTPAGAGHVSLVLSYAHREASSVYEAHKVVIPETLRPGESASFDLAIPTPGESGPYVLTVELELTGVARFSHHGLRPLRFLVEVLAPGTEPMAPLQKLELEASLEGAESAVVPSQEPNEAEEVPSPGPPPSIVATPVAQPVVAPVAPVAIEGRPTPLPTPTPIPELPLPAEAQPTPTPTPSPTPTPLPSPETEASDAAPATPEAADTPSAPTDEPEPAATTPTPEAG